MIGPYDELMTKHEELFKYLVYENSFMKSKSIESGADNLSHRFRQISRQFSSKSRDSSQNNGDSDQERFLQEQLDLVQSKQSIFTEQMEKKIDAVEGDRNEENDDDQYAEKRFKGSNSFKMYLLYLRTGYGRIGFVLFFALFSISQFLQTYTEYRLATW